MLIVYIVLCLPLFVTSERVQMDVGHVAGIETIAGSKDTLERVADGFLNVVDALLPVSRSCGIVEARKKKKSKLNKYVLPLLVGFLLIKSILLPIALKALAVLSGKAVVLSLMSLILAAIVGLKKVAQSSSGHSYHSAPASKYRRQDVLDISQEIADNEPYRFYKERKKK